MRKLLVLPLLVLAALALLAATGATASRRLSTSAARKSVVISTRKLPKLGVVLVDARGRTLYMFVPDKRKKVTCFGSCAAVWPPLELPHGARLVAKPGAKASLLGSDPYRAGRRVVTYNRWPLYTYVGDRAAGQATGQALNLNGGLWYVLAPSGKVIHTKP
jgi:predicted lipoprotein with Yx(FWY)xxD motif